jgi:hypothetical protein
MPKRKKKQYRFQPNLNKCYYCKSDLDLTNPDGWYNIAGINMCARCATERFVKLVEAWASTNKFQVVRSNEM